MREVGPALSRTVFLPLARAMDYPIDDPQALYSKTPARIRASAGVRFAKLTFAPGIEAGLNLGLGAGLPMPRGRQLTRARCRALTTSCIGAVDRVASRAESRGGGGQMKGRMLAIVLFALSSAAAPA